MPTSASLAASERLITRHLGPFCVRPPLVGPGVRFNRIKIDRGDDGGAFLGAFPV